MTKEIPRKLKQEARRRLLQIIEETSPEELLNMEDLGNYYTLKDGSHSYCIYQHGGGRWSFSKGERIIFDRSDDPLVDIFTKKVYQAIEKRRKRGIYDDRGLNGI